ncbi:MAG: DUF1501 domain-containing protein [Polyangiaceae bacterium]|jgi:uncharacterized protein (DUF1501 family)|nr:DUF1501 domain-containing protein [Polyangiaceae bacterium]
MLNRRSFLQLSGAAGVSLLGTRLGFAQAKKAGARPRALVVILQRGALDGLSAVVPYADAAYYEARPRIAIAPPGKGEGSALKLDGHFGLHPSLAPLKPLWESGTLALVHGAGSPDLTRSHFDAQDYVESGTPGLKVTADGWLNRVLAARPSPSGAADTPLRAVALQPGMPRILYGSVPAVAFASMGEFRLKGRAAESAAAARSFAEMYDEAVDRSLRETAGGAFVASKKLQALRAGADARTKGVSYPASALGRRLREIAQLLHADVGLEIAVTDCGGWDTHAGQGDAKGRLAGLLHDFGESLAAFSADLGDRLNEVCVVSATEFGRTVRENGTGGTDHGHGSIMFVLGGGVHGRKVYARWKGLEPANLHEGRDLPVTIDHREVFAEALRAQFKLKDLSSVFPGYTPKPDKRLGLFG